MTTTLELTLFLGAAFLVGSTFVVVARWFVGWRIARSSGAVKASLPLHVWLVALSYDLFVLGMCIRVYEDGADWPKAALYLPAIGFGIYGMLVLARAQKHRVDRADPAP